MNGFIPHESGRAALPRRPEIGDAQQRVPTNIIGYTEAIQFLYDLRLFGAKFGLENTFKLAALAGNPQDRLRFIHVAGTNGKGSTCAMLENIYRAAGLRVGLFTSPHLISFRERIQVNRRLIPEVAVVRLVGELQPLLKQFPTGHHPTFFEVVTVMALKFFSEQKCDLVIWETGLGGRLDATNIVTPLAGVITNIQFDHQQWLGDTLEKIAAEKAGIIKPGVPVITAADEPEALAVIEKTAREKHAPLIKVGQASSLSSAGKMPAPPLIGDHQKLNAALALATIETLQNKIAASDSAIRTGLETVNWPGRLQLVTRPSGQKFLLDGAHNVAGAKVLRKTLEKHFGGTRRILVLGVLQDKDWRHICETLAPLAARILTVPVSSERTANARELAAACRAVNSTAEIVACDSLREALGKIVSDDFIVVTGSLYLVGEALECLGLSPATSDERALNEWGARPQPLYTTR
jgi:dihydrofolate synthase/folylpolyglutamate synthase